MTWSMAAMLLLLLRPAVSWAVGVQSRWQPSAESLVCLLRAHVYVALRHLGVSIRRRQELLPASPFRTSASATVSGSRRSIRTELRVSKAAAYLLPLDMSVNNASSHLIDSMTVCIQRDMRFNVSSGAVRCAHRYITTYRQVQQVHVGGGGVSTLTPAMLCNGLEPDVNTPAFSATNVLLVRMHISGFKKHINVSHGNGRMTSLGKDRQAELCGGARGKGRVGRHGAISSSVPLSLCVFLVDLLRCAFRCLLLCLPARP